MGCSDRSCQGIIDPRIGEVRATFQPIQLSTGIQSAVAWPLYFIGKEFTDIDGYCSLLLAVQMRTTGGGPAGS